MLPAARDIVRSEDANGRTRAAGGSENGITDSGRRLLNHHGGLERKIV